MIVGIYKITHTKTNSIYIGQSVDIESRWKRHASELSFNEHHNFQFQDLWNQAVEEEFHFEVLESAPENITGIEQQEWLEKKERYYLSRYSSDKNYKVLNLAVASFVSTKQSTKEYRDKNPEARVVPDLIERLNDLNGFILKPRPKLEKLKKQIILAEQDLSSYRYKEGKRSIFGRIIEHGIFSSFNGGSAEEKRLMKILSDLQVEFKKKFQDEQNEIDVSISERVIISVKLKELRESENKALFEQSSIYKK